MDIGHELEAIKKYKESNRSSIICLAIVFLEKMIFEDRRAALEAYFLLK